VHIVFPMYRWLFKQPAITKPNGISHLYFFFNRRVQDNVSPLLVGPEETTVSFKEQIS
jgi:hypothetical protein